MTIDDTTKDDKLQYNIKREAAKISALLSRNIDTYEYFTGKEILSSNRSQIIQQAKVTYSRVRKALEKQVEKQVDALKFLNFSNKTDE